MGNKKSSLSMIIFGVLFIVLGIILFLIRSGNSIVTVIAILDVIFGLFLIVGNVLAERGGNSDLWSQEDYGYADDIPYRRDVQPAPAEFIPAEFIPTEQPIQEQIPDDPQELASRESEYRAAAKKAAEKAAEAKKVASAAVQDAKQADAQLRRAEAELAGLEPSQQRAAMREIDNLAQIAAQKSDIAVQAAHDAKAAIAEARAAAELHNRAMDAAAAALGGDDEFAEFN